MTTTAAELYVYYKAASSQAHAIRSVMQNWPQVRLLRRADESGDLQTWMEIHTGPEAGSAAQALGAVLAPHIAGPRHVERFEPVDLTRP